MKSAIPFLPEVVGASTDPLLLVTRRVPGSSLFEVVDSIDREHVGEQLARYLAAPHSDGHASAWRPPSARSGVVAAGHHRRAAGTVRRVGDTGPVAGRREMALLGRRAPVVLCDRSPGVGKCVQARRGRCGVCAGAAVPP